MYGATVGSVKNAPKALETRAVRRRAAENVENFKKEMLPRNNCEIEHLKTTEKNYQTS